MSKSSVFADMANQDGVLTLRMPFGEDAASAVVAEAGKVTLATATNVFAHVDNIRDFVSGISIFLKKNGVFIIEFPYLKNMLEENLFDVIYHEHLSYLSITPLKHMFSSYNLKIFNIEAVNVGASGPGLRIYVSHENSKFKSTNIVSEYLNLEEKLNYKKIEPYISFSKKVICLSILNNSSSITSLTLISGSTCPVCS